MIEQHITISASPETVWEFWTDPQLLCAWWGSSAEVEPEPGGSIRVEMSEGPVMVGAFVELEPYRRLVFSFGWEDNPVGHPMSPGSTRVEVTLTPSGGNTELVLRHTDVPQEHADSHAEGWLLYAGKRLPEAIRRHHIPTRA